ncbi:MAG: cytidylate kinase family protein, partial [Planctomycetales bacterium]|nr:cytidylate kinase family protein [Planctomycetales bacterium]
HWLLESIEALVPRSGVSESSYVRHLVETLFSLTASGGVVIVGRGGAQILPQATTLRVRVTAPLEKRVAELAQQLNLSPRDAKRELTDCDRRRVDFVKEHFHKDPTDATNYDLTLNTAWLNVDACAGLILQALSARQEALAHRPDKAAT